MLRVQHNDSRVREGIALLVHLLDGHRRRDARVAEAQRAGHLACFGHGEGIFVLIRQIAGRRLDLPIGVRAGRKTRNNRIPVVAGGILANGSARRGPDLDLAAGKARSGIRTQLSDARFAGDRRRCGALFIGQRPVFGVAPGGGEPQRMPGLVQLISIRRCDFKVGVIRIVLELHVRCDNAVIGRALKNRCAVSVNDPDHRAVQGRLRICIYLFEAHSFACRSGDRRRRNGGQHQRIIGRDPVGRAAGTDGLQLRRLLSVGMDIHPASVAPGQS